MSATLFTNIQIFEGTKPKCEPGEVLVEGERITRVATGRKQLPRDSGVEVIDGTGKFLMPGLIDSHIHLGANAIRDPKAPGAHRTGVVALHGYLYSGVTTVYDSGNNPDYIFPIREEERTGKIVAPRVFASGSTTSTSAVAFTAPQGEGTGMTVRNCYFQLHDQRVIAFDYDAPLEAEAECTGMQTLAAVATALTLARSAIAQEKWEDAQHAYTEARKSQAELNQRFPATRYADVAALDKIDGELASLRSAGLAAVVTARERDGDAAAKDGRAQEAAASYAMDCNWDLQSSVPMPATMRHKIHSLDVTHKLA